jgi:electron transfer flavoprotein-quinone oxidoreductase
LQKNSVDVIVVGAGPSGIAAATVLARAGKELSSSRGETFQEVKTCSAEQSIHSRQLKFSRILGNSPRRKTQHRTQICTARETDGTVVSYKNPNPSAGMYNSYSVQRAKWDKWCAQEAQKAGAYLVTETLVKELIVQGDKVIGISTDTEDFYAKIVILADGVNSILSKQIGFHKELKPEDVALAVKEVISLPKETIEQRFNLTENSGSIHTIVGGPMKGMLGLGYIYTNLNTVSIGLGISLKELQTRCLKPYDVLNDLKKHPLIAPLIKDGELKDYSAHLIPEGGYNSIPKLFGNGVMVVGDAAMLVNNIHWEGTNLAMMSGKFAAETAIDALEKNDFSENTLELYYKKLNNSFVLKDLRTYKDVIHTMEDNAGAFLEYYPSKINEFMHLFTSVDSIEKSKKFKSFISSIFKERSLPELLKEMSKLAKLAIGVLMK